MSSQEALPQAVRVSTPITLVLQPRRQRPRWWRRLASSRMALAGITLLAIVLLVALTAQWIAPYGPDDVDIRNRLKPPSWVKGGIPGHLFGTDNLGRDVLSRLIYGSRVSLFVGITSVLLGGFLGTLFGIAAGYFGGATETVVMRAVDVQLAFPSVLFAVAIMAVLGSSLQNVVLVLSIASWAAYCRVARAQTLALKSKEYVEASRAIGTSDWRIIARHILPNAVGPLIVIASFGVAINIINEASLSFLGVGVPPAIPTWGNMLGEGQKYIRLAWWFSVFPGIALMLTVFGVNVVGDWIRDYLDPQLRSLM